MRILEAAEITEKEYAFEVAKGEARLSLCRKTPRGAVVFRDGRIFGRGCNNPIRPRTCRPEICMPICGLICLHAERSAIANALRRGENINGASVFHIRLQNDIAVASRDPSCDDCSRYMAVDLPRKGIFLEEMILYQATGYIAYKIDEFHDLSIAGAWRKTVAL